MADETSTVIDRDPALDKSGEPSDPESDVNSVVGRPAKKTDGLVTAAIRGIRSIREGCARRVSIIGLQPSASSVAAGRRIRSGTNSEKTTICRSLRSAESAKQC